MKLFKSLFVFIICLFIFSQNIFAQDKLEPKLVDIIINPANCDDLVARLEAGYIANKNDSNLVAYVVIHPAKDNLLRSLLFERWTIGSMYGADKFIIVRGSAEVELRIEVWIASKNDKAFFSNKESAWDFTLKSVKKPFLFYSTTNGEDAVCGSKGQKKHFAEILLANPTFKGNLVFEEKTISEYKKIKNELLSELTNEYKIPRNRLRTYFVKSDYSNLEYWIVPTNTK